MYTETGLLLFRLLNKKAATIIHVIHLTSIKITIIWSKKKIKITIIMAFCLRLCTGDTALEFSLGQHT